MWVLLSPLLLELYGNWILLGVMSSPTLAWFMNLIGAFLGPILLILILPPALVYYSGQVSFLVLWGIGLSVCT